MTNLQKEHNEAVRKNAAEFADLARGYGHLSNDEIQAEIERLRKSAEADDQHADALLRYKKEHRVAEAAGR